MAIAITKRKALDGRRRRAASAGSTSEPPPTPSTEDLFFEALDESQCREIAMELVESVLDDYERKLFIACVYKGQRLCHIAAQEGITPQRVGQIVAAATRSWRARRSAAWTREGDS